MADEKVTPIRPDVNVQRSKGLSRGERTLALIPAARSRGGFFYSRLADTTGKPVPWSRSARHIRTRSRSTITGSIRCPSHPGSSAPFLKAPPISGAFSLGGCDPAL